MTEAQLEARQRLRRIVDEAGEVELAGLRLTAEDCAGLDDEELALLLEAAGEQASVAPGGAGRR